VICVVGAETVKVEGVGTTSEVGSVTKEDDDVSNCEVCGGRLPVRVLVLIGTMEN
jgi:hypothetical protein